MKINFGSLVCDVQMPDYLRQISFSMHDHSSYHHRFEYVTDGPVITAWLVG